MIRLSVPQKREPSNLLYFQCCAMRPIHSLFRQPCNGSQMTQLLEAFCICPTDDAWFYLSFLRLSSWKNLLSYHRVLFIIFGEARNCKQLFHNKLIFWKLFSSWKLLHFDYDWFFYLHEKFGRKVAQLYSHVIITAFQILFSSRLVIVAAYRYKLWKAASVCATFELLYWSLLFKFITYFEMLFLHKKSWNIFVWI